MGLDADFRRLGHSQLRYCYCTTHLINRIWIVQEFIDRRASQTKRRLVCLHEPHPLANGRSVTPRPSVLIFNRTTSGPVPVPAEIRLEFGPVQALDSREGLRRAQSLVVAQDLVWVSAPGLGQEVVGFSQKPPISPSSLLIGCNLRS